ncbi:putative DeoR family transcriptional regulator [Streptomyces sp. NBRC 110611]|uniref:helix-turn-helix transcriptional regulator n=1 Tax=Streptomyces sp. NBRC 110611 TaxID=1621259 RepID=UPI000833DF50|nr:YafY family protein [Streptomyces sp. NBRC 110611]GAU65401.1 putative DeoR family transcriptional regulator [Streptomyces sp. NBRC 110611]
MSETSARLLNLLSLLQTPREWPGRELAERLGVTSRTIRRDIERLRDLGYPVHATMGAEGGYRLAAGTAMPPLLLDDEEAVAIAVGLRSTAGHTIAGIEEASVRALAKLEQVLPARLRRRVGTLGTATVPMPGDGGPTVDPEHLTVLAAAITNHERLRFRYRAGAGAVSKRLVEPHRLVAAGRRWYLVAYDNDREDWRIFRVDRLSEPFPTGVRATPRELPAADAGAYVRARMQGMTRTHRAVATVYAPAAEVAARLGGPAAGEVEALDEASCRWHSTSESLEWLAMRLALLGREFTVDEPPELVAYLREMGGRVSRAAGGSAADPS